MRGARAAAAVLSFVRLGRPKFLVGGFLLYGLGAAVARRRMGAPIDVGAYALGQAVITLFQLMTHYANDYFDLAADRANTTPTKFSGGSRVLVEGALPPVAALAAAVVLGAGGLALALSVWLRAGFVPALVALLAGALAWSYSAPPMALHSRGAGELTTAIVVAGLTPLLGYLMQAGGGASALAGVFGLASAVLPLAGLQLGMLLAIEFPDAAGDGAAGKRTLVVRLGAPAAAALYRAVLVAVYGAIPLFVLAGLPPQGGLGLALSAPIAAWQFWRLGRGDFHDPTRWEGMVLRAVAMLIASSVGELAAFVWLALRPAGDL